VLVLDDDRDMVRNVGRGALAREQYAVEGTAAVEGLALLESKTSTSS
jgi:hypothetical protein